MKHTHLCKTFEESQQRVRKSDKYFVRIKQMGRTLDLFINCLESGRDAKPVEPMLHILLRVSSMFPKGIKTPNGTTRLCAPFCDLRGNIFVTVEGESYFVSPCVPGKNLLEYGVSRGLHAEEARALGGSFVFTHVCFLMMTGRICVDTFTCRF